MFLNSRRWRSVRRSACTKKVQKKSGGKSCSGLIQSGCQERVFRVFLRFSLMLSDLSDEITQLWIRPLHDFSSLFFGLNRADLLTERHILNLIQMIRVAKLRSFTKTNVFDNFQRLAVRPNVWDAFLESNCVSLPQRNGYLIWSTMWKNLPVIWRHHGKLQPT